MDDYKFLLRAYELGGAVVVNDPLSRASLMAVGFMEPAPNVVIYGLPAPKAMRLTKAGCQRVADILKHKEDGLTSKGKYDKKRRKNINMSLTTQPASSYTGTSYNRIKNKPRVN